MSNNDIYLRPLQESDSHISYIWRNNPDIWKYTGSKPNKYITPEIEMEWIKDVLKRDNEKRYAICTFQDDKYVGNVQLTKIENGRAEFHIFIGVTDYWGKGIGKLATKKIIDIGFKLLKLKSIYLEVKKSNIPAVKAYLSVGFIIDEEINNNYIMSINKNDESSKSYYHHFELQ